MTLRLFLLIMAVGSFMLVMFSFLGIQPVELEPWQRDMTQTGLLGILIVNVLEIRFFGHKQGEE